MNAENNEQLLSQYPVEKSRSQKESEDGAVIERQDERARQLSIGMYHQKAGLRDAGGIAMYTQEMIDAIAAHQPAYLYTEVGKLTPKMQQTDAEVIQLIDAAENKLFEQLFKYLSTLNFNFSTNLKQKLYSVVGMVGNGMIQHMNEHVDVLITHDLMDNMILSNLLDIPVVNIYHGFKHTGAITRAQELFSVSYSVVNSMQTRKEFTEQRGHSPDGIVYPGVDIDLFTPTATPAFKRDQPTILFVGRFVPSKGVFDLIDAVAQIPQDIHLHLVGRGERDRLIERIRTHGLESVVTINESIPHDELPGFYTAADVLCLPSHYESFGMVNLEAMACGTPVVTTNLPGITEYAVDGKTAMVVPPKQPYALGKAIETVLTSSGLRTKLSKNGQATAKRYSWEISAKNLVNTCLTIIEENHA